MDTILTDLSPQALSRANQENSLEFMRALTGGTGCSHVQGGRRLAYIHNTLTDFPMFNYVGATRLDASEADSAIRAVVAYYQARGRKPAWFVWPGDTPADLGRRLAEHGFRCLSEQPCMAITVAGLSAATDLPPGLRITRVEDREGLAPYMSVVSVGFGFSPEAADAFGTALEGCGFAGDGGVGHYVGWRQSEPVATGTLLYAAGVAGIYNIVTLPKSRRQGIGRAMTVFLLHQARARGYRAAVLQASDMGRAVYERIGFHTTDMRGWYWLSEE